MVDDPRWIVLLVIFGILVLAMHLPGFAPWVGCTDGSNLCHVGHLGEPVRRPSRAGSLLMLAKCISLDRPLQLASGRLR
jgi:hypothetical protein